MVCMVFVCIYMPSSRGHLRCPSLLQALAQSRQHWKPQPQSWAWDLGGQETLSPFWLTLRKAALLVILCCTEFSVKHLFLVFPPSPAYGWMTSWWWGVHCIYLYHHLVGIYTTVLLYTFAKTNQTAHLNGVCFGVWKSFFNKVKVDLMNWVLREKKCETPKLRTPSPALKSMPSGSPVAIRVLPPTRVSWGGGWELCRNHP